MQGSPAQALDYCAEGARLIIKPGFRRFILIPLLVNLVIFVGVTIALFYAFQDFFTLVLNWMPTWLNWLAWLLWPIVGFIFLGIYG